MTEQCDSCLAINRQNAELADALRHYADESNWNLFTGNPFGMTGACVYTFGSTAQNGYDVAQAALAAALSADRRDGK